MNKKIVLASKSPLKKFVVEYVTKYFFKDDEFEIVQYDVEDKGPEPFTEAALLIQLQVALHKIKDLEPDAAYYIVMEGGVREMDNELEEISCVIIEDASGRQSKSWSTSFPIPEEVAKKVQKGMPFADAVDAVYSTKDIKNNQGFIGLLTDNFVDKKMLYVQPTAVAFGKFLKSNWFWK
jgi:non-canonical (house-cleaning) NTP pyrophosphatase